jgi:hypothetical protein
MTTHYDYPAFLRRVLLADAAVSAASGVLQVLLAGLLESVLRIPAHVLLYSGLALIPYGAFVAYIATRRQAPLAAVWVVIACNILWAADCVLALWLGWIQPSPIGNGFVLFQAAAVVMFADLEYMGVRRMTRLAA